MNGGHATGIEKTTRNGGQIGVWITGNHPIPGARIVSNDTIPHNPDGHLVTGREAAPPLPGTIHPVHFHLVHPPLRIIMTNIDCLLYEAPKQHLALFRDEITTGFLTDTGLILGDSERMMMTGGSEMLEWMMVTVIIAPGTIENGHGGTTIEKVTAYVIKVAMSSGVVGILIALSHQCPLTSRDLVLLPLDYPSPLVHLPLKNPFHLHLNLLPLRIQLHHLHHLILYKRTKPSPLYMQRSPSR